MYNEKQKIMIMIDKFSQAESLTVNFESGPIGISQWQPPLAPQIDSCLPHSPLLLVKVQPNNVHEVTVDALLETMKD